jgi:RHH-type proline utilization regulon transcriptional repressor/proline dehydrogenase/delta 1-pyrroline-5-carboxylate dehydrogenase
VVDSSALVEQVVTDVLASAFDSAGQRCSALRVLCVQEDVANRLLHMLRGAMAETTVGHPAALRTDIGPVIDEGARQTIEAHVESMRQKGRRVHRLGRWEHGVLEHGTYVLPTLIELDAIAELQREVFGPVLHVVRYARRDLDTLLGQINATGYGLTLGVHTRIDETIEQVVGRAAVGNIYVNRNMVGAVVGVQPFGGEGLSGTGPKAGGPLYMYRLLAKRPDNVLARAGALGLPGSVEAGPAQPLPTRFLSLLSWLATHRDRRLAGLCQSLAERAGGRAPRLLVGPTGERNVYALHPRKAALCLADSDDALLVQTAGALLVGCRAIWPMQANTHALRSSLPQDVQEQIALATDWTAPGVEFDVALHQGSLKDMQATTIRLAEREGPIVCLHRFAMEHGELPLEALVIERAVSTNTAAAGGNASLMTIA